MPNVLLSGFEIGIVTLPAGYDYADPDSITYDEFLKLNDEVYGPPASPLQRPCFSSNEDCIRVGVRTQCGELVGYGRLAVKGYIGSGELSDLVVHGNHQYQGIGTAILKERIRIADKLGISSLYILGLADTNNISSKYLELGFEPNQKGILWRYQPQARLETA